MAQNEFTRFLDASPTPYHAVRSSVQLLKAAGFQELQLADQWRLQRGGRYFVVKALSTVVAFAVGGRFEASNGFVLVGAHTDSPCLKVRPVSRLAREGFKQVAVSTYGGGIWRTWFDRALGLAGVATVRRGERLEHRLVELGRRPLLFIPNLAIHLETERANPKIDNEEQLQPIFCLSGAAGEQGAEKGDHHEELVQLVAEECKCAPDEVVDFDLRTFCTEPAQLGGLKQEFVFSGRLDNLFGVFTAVQGLIQSGGLEQEPLARVVACFDHEECGSNSAAGARSALLEQVLRRIRLADEPESADAFARAVARSYIVSADQAHGAHPNFPDRHERHHRPRFDGSCVVKINADQRYATTSTSFSVLSELARRADVKLTKFVVKNTSPCGSTIGPFVSANLGALTIDVGFAQLAMHSCRECGDAKAVDQAIKLYKTTFGSYHDVLANLDLNTTE